MDQIKLVEIQRPFKKDPMCDKESKKDEHFQSISLVQNQRLYCTYLYD